MEKDWKKIGAHVKQKLEKTDRQKWIVLLLVGVLLLVIALPTDSATETEEDAAGQGTSWLLGSTENSTGEDDTTLSSTDSYEAHLESRLEEMISKVEGVGEVEVMITLEDMGESVVVEDSLYETKQIRPEIRGVCVVAQGASNAQIKVEIYKMVQALFSLEAHKISIVEMGVPEGT
jgi:stage III sporulation protein AG